MKTLAKRLHGLLMSATVLGATALMASTVSAATPPDPSRYPILDEKQLGSLNHIVHLLGQADDDWSGWLMPADMRGADDHVRYQMGFMSFGLYTAVHTYTPAYRELGERASNNMIRKMFNFIAWNDMVPWRSLPYKAKGETVPYGFFDPTEDFIMYTGHLYPMLATHEMLFNDKRFSQPKSLKFAYPPTNGAPADWSGLPGPVYTYDLASLTQRIYNNFEKNDWKGVECLPNALFVICNQQPILGFKMYDNVNGTNYFTTLSAHYKKVWEEDKLLDAKTKTWAAHYLIGTKDAKWEYPPNRMHYPTYDGWAGLTAHAWNKDVVEKAYATQRDRDLVILPDGTATTWLDEKETKKSREEMRSGDAATIYSEGHSLLAAFVAEIGDTATKAKLLGYADKYYSPKWDGDSYYYPISSQFKRPGDPANVWRRVQPLAANATLPTAWILPKDGLYDLYNHPFTQKVFEEPYLSNVAYPDVQVPRAIYDEQKKALIVTLRPGRTASTSEVRSWTFNNLASNQDWSVWQDGRKVATLHAGAVTPADGVTGFQAQGTALNVSMPVAKETTFIVAQE